MRVSDFLAEAERLPIRSLDAVTGGRGLLVVAPHPDDESLGCGGLIATAVAAGIAVRLVVVSDGVGSHSGSRRYPPDRLRALREAETLASAAALGLAETAVRFLRLPDRSVPREGAAAEAAAVSIAAEAGVCDAGAVFVTWPHDPHCDHLASAAIVDLARPRLGAADVYHYPIWGWTLDPEVEVGAPPSGFRLDIAAVLPTKTEAIAAHRSQLTDLIDDDPNGFRLTPDMLANFAKPFEIFVKASGGAS